MTNKSPTIIKVILIIFSSLSIIAANPSFAAHTLTTGVKITRIDAIPSSANIRVQTEPRPDTAPLQCSDYWLVLNKDETSFQELYALLVTAKVNNLTVTVGASNTNTTEGFCHLSRLVID